MGWEFQYSDSQNYAKIICEGELTLEDCLQMNEDLLVQPFWKPGLNVLTDCRKSHVETIKPGDLRLLAESYQSASERLGRGKTALIVGSVRDYGLSRQYGMLSETRTLPTFMVFYSEAEAIAWLNSDE